jgi:pimeloyl-ACP methyl ester carboxylesterase
LVIAEDLLDEALSEIRRRDPVFLKHRNIDLPQAGDAAAFYPEHPLFLALGEAATVDRLARGFAFLARRGLRSRAGPPSLLGRLLCDSIVDAFAAEAGLIALRPAGPPPALGAVLAADYDQRCTDGVPYSVRRRGSRWLLLVNAVGMPLSVWSALLADPAHDFRVLVIDGGRDDLDRPCAMDRTLEDEVEAIRRILAGEAAQDVTVLGWCSGGRVAAEVAALEPGRVAQLILASATFRGAMADVAPLTRFEQDVDALFASIRRDPGSAAGLSRMLVQAQGAACPAADEAALLRLPAEARAADLTAPFATADRLRAYAARLAGDHGHDAGETLARIAAPVLAISGAQDQVIANENTLAVLRASTRRLSAVEIRGAGHYAQDLQYAYFRMLLEDAAAGRPPTACARVNVLTP